MALKTKAKLVVNRSGNPPIYELGEQLKIGFKADSNLYLYVLDAREDRNVSLLYPGSGPTDNYVKAEQNSFIPPQKGIGFKVREPLGLVKLWAIGLNEPIDIYEFPIDELVKKLMLSGIIAEAHYYIRG